MAGKRKSTTPIVRYAARMVRCGKEGCAKCPHGPYWYEITWVKGKRRLRYVGKKRPKGAECIEVQDPHPPPG